MAVRRDQLHRKVGAQEELDEREEGEADEKGLDDRDGADCGGVTLPPHPRWGGGPGGAWWRGSWRGLGNYPSTTLRVVPLPTGSAGREAKKGDPHPQLEQ
jgi:hypothetical protein